VGGAGQIQSGLWSLTGRFVLADSDRSPVEFSLAHRLRDDLQVGIEYDPEEGEVYPLVNWRFMEATEDRPALAVGTSSAWPSREVDGNAVFLTAAQNLGAGLSGSLSLSYGIEDERVRVPASLNYTLSEGWTGTMIYDGDNLHPVVTVRRTSLSYSLILLNGEEPTISISWGF
jgi:hypothetical protein